MNKKSPETSQGKETPTGSRRSNFLRKFSGIGKRLTGGIQKRVKAVEPTEKPPRTEDVQIPLSDTMNIEQIRDLFDIIDHFEDITAYLRGRSESEIESDLKKVESIAKGHLSRFSESDLRSFSIYYTDKFYRIVSSIGFMDAISFQYLKVVGDTINEVLQKNGVKIAYFIDNTVDEGRMEGTKMLFSTLNFRVLVLEEIIEELRKAIGGGEPQQFANEAAVVGLRVLEKFAQDDSHIVFISHHIDIPIYRELMNDPALRPYLRLLRNEAPIDGTNIVVAQPNEDLPF